MKSQGMKKNELGRFNPCVKRGKPFIWTGIEVIFTLFFFRLLERYKLKKKKEKSRYFSALFPPRV